MALLSKMVIRPSLSLLSRGFASAATEATAPTLTASQKAQANELRKKWAEEPRWAGVKRSYSAEDVVTLRTSLLIEHTLAKHGAERLWKSLTKEEPYVHALGAMSGNQAVQQVKAGLKAIYLSGWQVAADANSSGEMYPDLSLYPANSVPNVVRNINKALARADQIQNSEGKK